MELVQKEGNRTVHDERVYHLGASIKDLGKKWFAFNRMEMTTAELLQKILYIFKKTCSLSCLYAFFVVTLPAD